jgi:hypothetical protein
MPKIPFPAVGLLAKTAFQAVYIRSALRDGEPAIEFGLRFLANHLLTMLLCYKVLHENLLKKV